MKIRIFDTPHDAGIYVAALAERVIMSREQPVLGLATGITPVAFYEALVRLQTHIVKLRNETVISNARFFENIEDVPKQAITMGIQAILQAEQIVLMAFGHQKASIVAETVKGNVRTNVPASVLQLHRNVTVVLDQESASELT
ncbi:MAG: 6-phosphogluconolactonase [Desulfitobacteriaceae bacterium]